MGDHRATRRGESRRRSVSTPPRRRATPAPQEQAAPPVASRQSEPGRRRASRHSASRGPLFRSLPSIPVLIGVSALAVAATGAVTVAPQQLVGMSSGQHRMVSATSLSGVSGTSSTDLLDRGPAVSRDSRRDAQADASNDKLVAAAEQQYRQRNATLRRFAQQVEAQSEKIALNQWVAPTDPIVLTARFGDYGLWSGYHTGLDFNGNTGDPIYDIAAGVVTSAGYDGSYGNKTVVTLDDGTEIWYCHQNQFNVSVGDHVRPGQLIGYIGSTGHVTGSHLHVEVRPGGGDPVDPYTALTLHGVALPP